MPPYQPPQVTPPGQPTQSQDPYHFIMNPEQPRRSYTPNKMKGILFIVGAVSIILILFIVILSMIRGGGGVNEQFITIAQEQQEIIRVAGLQEGAVQKQNTKNFITNTSLSLKSDQAKLRQFMAEHGVKVSEKQLALKRNATTDTELTSAISTSTLDAVLTKELQDELTVYQSTLGKTYQATTGKQSRTLLVELNETAKLLLAQSKQ